MAEAFNGGLAVKSKLFYSLIFMSLTTLADCYSVLSSILSGIALYSQVHCDNGYRGVGFVIVIWNVPPLGIVIVPLLKIVGSSSIT